MNGALVKKWMSEQGDNGLKPEELAVKLDVSYSTVRSIMAGKKPYQNTVKVLASLMGVSVQELLKEPKKATSSKKVTVD